MLAVNFKAKIKGKMFKKMNHQVSCILVILVSRTHCGEYFVTSHIKIISKCLHCWENGHLNT